MMSNLYSNLPRPFFVLAPMDDVTDVVFRTIVAGCSAPDLFFTEFVNVDGLQSPGRSKLMPRLAIGKLDRPIIAQIWGLKPENFEKTAAELAGMGFDGIDLNFGCPDKTVVKNGACSALMLDRGKAAEIIAATKRGAAAGAKAAGATTQPLPVSVKTRLGFNAVDLGWIEFVLQQGIDALTIHFRTRKEMSKVPAQWEHALEIIKLRDKISPQTVLIGNGDVLTRTQGMDYARTYGLDGIMIGRGIFADPFCFSAGSTTGSPWLTYTKEQRIKLFQDHAQLFAKTWPNGERNFRTLNKFCKIYINGFDGAKEMREHIMGAANAAELLGYLDGQ